MTTKRSELSMAVMNLVNSSKNPRKAAKSVASYLIDEHRTKELHSLVRDLEELQYKNDGILEVTATSATPLTPEAKRQIKSLFTAKTIRIHQEINKELRGGVQVRALDKVADFSVQARLRKLRQGA